MKQICHVILAIICANITSLAKTEIGFSKSPSVVQASYHAEPGTNVGISISVLRQVFPNLTFTKSDYQGDHYYDGEDPSEGVTCMFTVKNNIVVEECMLVQDTNVFPLIWWRKICDKFYNDHTYRAVDIKPGHYKFYYSKFTIDLIYIEEGEHKTALCIYKLL